MNNCDKNSYNTFKAVDTATKSIVEYLVDNNEDLWKLLYYFGKNELPLSYDNLTKQQKINMICTDPYDVNNNVDKSVLFQTIIDEAFTIARPQIRIEVGDIIPLNYVNGCIVIDIQIIVPNKQDVFTAPYNNVARRTDAIARELFKTLNGAKIPNSYFYSAMFMDRTASGGRETGSIRVQMNKELSGRWCKFSVLVGK